MQLYVGYPDTAIVRPTKQLRGFKRIHLAAGETQTVTFPLRGEALTYWDESKNRFALEAGMVDVKVGASSADIRAIGLADDAPLTAIATAYRPSVCCRRSFGRPARLRLPSHKEAACPSIDPSSESRGAGAGGGWRPGRPGRRARSAASSSRAATRS